jgi:hypothetical protein
MHAGHFTIAIHAEPGGKHRIEALAPRQNSRHTSANWPLANIQRPIAANNGGVANLDTSDIGDCVERPWCAIEGQANIAYTSHGISFILPKDIVLERAQQQPNMGERVARMKLLLRPYVFPDFTIIIAPMRYNVSHECRNRKTEIRAGTAGQSSR